MIKLKTLIEISDNWTNARQKYFDILNKKKFTKIDDNTFISSDKLIQIYFFDRVIANIVGTISYYDNPKNTLKGHNPLGGGSFHDIKEFKNTINQYMRSIKK